MGGEGATAGLVERHNLGVSCPNDVQELKRTLRRIITGAMTLNRPDLQTVSRFEYRSLAGSLAQLLEAVVGEAAVSK